MCKTFEDLAEKRVLEDRKITAKMLLSKGNMSVEEIAVTKIKRRYIWRVQLESEYRTLKR